MKKYFLTGLILIFPLTISLLLSFWLLYILSIPLYSFFHTYFMSSILSRFFSILSVVAIIILFGYCAQYYIIKKIVDAVHSIFSRLPIVRNIYHAAHEAITVLSRKDSRGFSQTVLLKHPSEKSRVVGFIPRKDINFTNARQEPLTPIFIPGTVNPLMGFLVFTTHEYFELLKTPAQDAFIWTLSLGGNNPFTVKSL